MSFLSSKIYEQREKAFNTTVGVEGFISRLIYFPRKKIVIVFYSRQYYVIRQYFLCLSPPLDYMNFERKEIVVVNNELQKSQLYCINSWRQVTYNMLILLSRPTLVGEELYTQMGFFCSVKFGRSI